MLNSVNLQGRLVKDAELKSTQSGISVASFSIAVQSRRKDSGGNYISYFINCVAFGKIAETVEKHVFKGSKIAVIGEWTTGSYKNKDGNTVYTNDCNISKLEFCDSKSQSNSQPQTAPSVDMGFMNIDTDMDSLPFN